MPAPAKPRWPRPLITCRVPPTGWAGWPDGNTVCDFDPEEIRRKASVSLALLPVEWKDTKMNLLDTPGLFDFAGGKSEGFRAAGSTVIVVSGKSGVTVGAEKAFDAATKKGIAKLFFVNKLDNENADFYKVFEELKTRFGPMVCPLVVPYVEDRRVQCYVNLLEYKAYAYENGKAWWNARCPDMGPLPGRPAHRDQRGGRGDR